MNNLEDMDFEISFDEVLELIREKAISSSTHILNAVKEWQLKYDKEV